MTAPALSRKAAHLLYEIPTEQFIFKERPSPSNSYSPTSCAADIMVPEQPEYPDIPSSLWTVVLKITHGQVSASVSPKEPTGTKSANTVMVNWKVGLENELFEGRIEPNAWTPAVGSTYNSLSGLLAPASVCGNCREGCSLQLRRGLSVFVSLSFVVEKAARKDLECLLESHIFSDCTLVCGTKKLPAHRAILAAQSPVFAAMFENEMKEKLSGVCKIDDTRSEVLETLVQYAYTRVPLKADGTLLELWIAADKYDMKELRAQCELTMLQAVTAENAYKFLCFAEERGLKKLRAEAAKCIFQQPL